MRRARALLLTLLPLLLCACSSGSAPARSPGAGPSGPGTIVITAGTPGGVYYAWATALAIQVHDAHPALTLRVEPSSGSVENLVRLKTGQADLAISAVDAAEDVGVAGSATGDQAGAVRIAAVARIYDDYFHVIVRKDSGLTDLDDLDGATVAVGDPGSGTALIAQRVLELAKVKVTSRKLGLTDGLRALAKGDVAAVFWSGGVPTAAVAGAAGDMPLRLLGLGDLPARMRATYGPVYRPAAIPPGRYGLPQPVDTFALANILVTRQDADPAMIAAIVSTIFDRRQAIARAVPAANQTDRRTAILTGDLQLHPAAAAYYRRVKL